MSTIEEFVELLRDQFGLHVTSDDVDKSFDELPNWDSLHLLWLVMLLERRTGREISMPDVLEAPNLKHIYTLAVAG
jgi:acyl carrier protein